MLTARMTRSLPDFLGCARLCAMVLLLLLALCQWSAQGKPAIAVRDHSKVTGEAYCLRDVASISGASEKEAARLGAIELGRTPSLGYRMPIHPRYLEQVLRRQGVSSDNAQLILPDKIYVSRASQMLDVEALADAVIGTIKETLPYGESKIMVEDLFMPKAVLLPKGNVRYDVRLRMGRGGVGSIPFQVDVLVDDVKARSLSGAARVDVEVEVLKCVGPRSRGEELTWDGLEVASGRLSDIRGEIVTPRDLEQGLVARRQIRPGDILTWDSVRREQLVYRGETVRMVLGNDQGLRITTLGQAREDGALGDTIEMVNLKSGEKVYGEIIADQVARVSF